MIHTIKSIIPLVVGFLSPEQEKKDGVFSPQLNAYAVNSQTNKQPELLAEAGHSCEGGCQSNSYPESTMEQSDSVPIVHDYGTTTSRSTSEKGSEPNPTDAEDKCFSQNEDGACRQLLFTDVLCAGCSQLLFHPVVLNCGHGMILIYNYAVFYWQKHKSNHLFYFFFFFLFWYSNNFCQCIVKHVL